MKNGMIAGSALTGLILAGGIAGTVGLAFIAAPFVSIGQGSQDSDGQDDATTVVA